MRQSPQPWLLWPWVLAASSGCPASLESDSSAQPCTPNTCSQLGAECGSASAGCGLTLNCGECAWPLSCGFGEAGTSCGCALQSFTGPAQGRTISAPQVLTDSQNQSHLLYTLGDAPEAATRVGYAFAESCGAWHTELPTAATSRFQVEFVLDDQERPNLRLSPSNPTFFEWAHRDASGTWTSETLPLPSNVGAVHSFLPTSDGRVDLFSFDDIYYLHLQRNRFGSWRVLRIAPELLSPFAILEGRPLRGVGGQLYLPVHCPGVMCNLPEGTYVMTFEPSSAIWTPAALPGTADAAPVTLHADGHGGALASYPGPFGPSYAVRNVDGTWSQRYAPEGSLTEGEFVACTGYNPQTQIFGAVVALGGGFKETPLRLLEHDVLAGDAAEWTARELGSLTWANSIRCEITPFRRVSVVYKSGIDVPGGVPTMTPFEY